MVEGSLSKDEWLALHAIGATKLDPVPAAPVVARLIDLGLIEVHGTGWRPTPEGWLLTALRRQI